MDAVVADTVTLWGRPLQVGPYTLIRRIGQGGMAEVFLACTEDGRSRQFFALKLVLPHLRDEPGFEKMLLREAAIAARLEHPNIVKVVGFSESEHYIAMEYVDGKPLRDVMRRATDYGPPPLQVSLSIIHSLASALHAAHEAVDEWDEPLGLVHRDVTPSNVLVSFDGVVKLADFGIAKATTRVHTTIGGAMKGKIGYMSPEQCRCEPLDRRSDLFSLGVLLYELALGQRLFPAINEFGIMGRLLRGEFPRPRDVNPDFPEELDEIIARATAVEAKDRYQTADELAAALEEFAADFGFSLGGEPIRGAMDSMYPVADRVRVEWIAAEILDGMGEDLETWEWSGEGVPEEEEFFSVTEPMMIAPSETPAYTGPHPAVPIKPAPRPATVVAGVMGACLAAFALVAGTWFTNSASVGSAAEPALVQSGLLPLRGDSQGQDQKAENVAQVAVTQAEARPSQTRPPTPTPHRDAATPTAEKPEEIVIVADDAPAPRPRKAQTSPRSHKSTKKAPGKKARKNKATKPPKRSKRGKKQGWKDSLDEVRPFRGGK